MKQKNRLAILLIFMVIAAVLLTGCGGGGGGGGSSNSGSSSSSTAPKPDPTPTPTPTPTPDPVPTPTPDPEPVPGQTVTLTDPANGVTWVVQLTSKTTGKIVGRDTSKDLPQKLAFPSKLGDYTITAIGSGIFGNSENIVELTVPDSVTTIDDWAFSSMGNLQKATIKGPAKLGKYLFYYCSSLKEVSLNNGITEIPDYAFTACRKLQTINFPAKLEKIGEHAFYYALGIEEGNGMRLLSLPEFPDTLTTIGESAFEQAGINGIVTIPSGVRKVEKNAFKDSGLEYVKLASGVKEIGEGAFAGTTNSMMIHTIYLPHSIERIGKGAFTRCVWQGGYKLYYEGSESEWKKVAIDAGNESWSDARIFYEVTPEKYDAVRNGTPDEVVWRFRSVGDGVVELTGYDPNGVVPSGNVVLPDAVDTVSGKMPVISVTGFFGCTGITGVKIPDSVRYINMQAFYGCTGLTSITLPEGVQSIGDSAFYGCTSLTSISLPAGVTEIGRETFKNCTALTSISLKKGLTTIGDSAFNGCASLSNVTLPNTLRSIGEQAFVGCLALRHITLPEGLQTIGKRAFEEDRLLEITIPASVTKIGDGAFYYNTYMEKAVIKGNVQFEESTKYTIGVFYGCGLKEVQLNDNITVLPDNMFSGPITKINLPSRLQTIGKQALWGCKVSELKLPDMVTTVGEGAFQFVETEKIALSKGLKKLPYRVFYYANKLKAVYIPKSITSIELSAFENCRSLKDIYYEGSEADWEKMNIEATGNEALTTATIHYNASVNDLGLTPEVSLLSFLGF